MNSIYACRLMIDELREALESYDHTVNGNLTFHGVLHKYFDEIAKSSYWKKEATLRAYQLDYKNLILNKVSYSKPLSDLSKEDFDDVIEEIKAEYRDKRMRSLSLERTQHFRRLISRVVKIAAKHELCDDLFWGTVFNERIEDVDDKKQENETKMLMNLQKSLSPIDEINIFNEIMTDPAAPGQNIGLALMFCAGLRNEEACGLNFGDIREMQEHPGDYCIRVFKSTEGNTNKLQPGGKTKNAPRMIPIPDTLASLLLKRKEYVSDILSRITADPFSEQCLHTVDINSMPIACRKNEYYTRCFAKDLSLAGRLLFKKIGMKERMVQSVQEEIDAALSEGIADNQELPVKDATTYLFRRNMATHMYILGMAETQIKYIMGHAVEDDYESRSSFSNEDNLWSIKEMLDKRPLVSSRALDIQKPIEINGGMTENGRVHSISFCAKGHVKLSVATNEPDDQLWIRVKTENGALVPIAAFISEASNRDYSHQRTIDVTAIYQKSYRQKLKRNGDTDTDSSD